MHLWNAILRWRYETLRHTSASPRGVRRKPITWREEFVCHLWGSTLWRPEWTLVVNGLALTSEKESLKQET